MSRYPVRFAYEQKAHPGSWGGLWFNMEFPFGAGADTRGTLGLELPLLAEGAPLRVRAAKPWFFSHSMPWRIVTSGTPITLFDSTM
jgi:hypothetical protein